jgi:hypothetical protein
LYFPFIFPQYQSQCPKSQKFLPFASEDLDFYGGKVEANESFENGFVGQENGREKWLISPLR